MNYGYRSVTSCESQLFSILLTLKPEHLSAAPGDHYIIIALKRVTDFMYKPCQFILRDNCNFVTNGKSLCLPCGE